MDYRNRYGKINVKLIIILVLVTVALGVSLVAARQIRRSILSKMSLQAGQAAFEKGDWSAAYKNLQEYLGRNPDDVEILKKYAKARLSIRPLDRAHIAGAISAYRRVLQLAPLDEVAYDQLAKLYPGVGDFEDLAYIARMRLDRIPNDIKAQLWLGDALHRLNKTEEARQTLDKLVTQLEALSDKHIEYVKACAQMCQLAAADDSADAKAEALKWLNKAVAYDTNSVEALASRAAFYRQAKNIPGIEENDRMKRARDDLEAADGRGTEDPRIRYFLGLEWLAHNELDRAAQELQVVDKLPQEKLDEYFLDPDAWKVQRFLLASQLVMRRGTAAEGVALANKTLAALKETRYRIQVLPIAIPFYVADANVPEARKCLNEYVDARHIQEGAKESRAQLAYLQALVARAEGNWYAVINVLQPVVVSDASRPELWRLLAEAFSRTDQSRRAVGALTTYLRNNPGNPEMTRLLAREYLRLGQWDRALETARLAETLNPADFTVGLLRLEASVYVAAEQQQEPTEASFREILEKLAQLRTDHPDQVYIRILQARIAETLKQPDKAEAELKLAIEECKEPLQAEMELVALHRRASHLDQAMSVCQAACERHADVAEPWLSLASLYVAKEDYEGARGCLKKGLDATTDKWEKRSLSIQLALLELTHGDQATGIELLSDLAEQDPQEIRARTLLLSIPAILKDQAKAQGLINELKNAEGQSSGLSWRMHQAALWLSSDQWRSKQQDITNLLRTCIDLDPQWSAPPLLLVSMYEKLNDVTHAEETCRQALARDPSAMDIADRLATLLERQGRSSDAEQVLRQVEADPRVASAWRIRTALHTGEFSRAIEELKLRVSDDKDERDASSRILLARLIYLQTKDAAQALEYVRQAEAITPGSLVVTGLKAAILRAEGRAPEGQKVLDDYVAKRKDDFAAYQMRAAYLAREGQWEQAEEDYRKLTTFEDKDKRVLGYQLLSNFYVSRSDPNRSDPNKAVAALEEGLKVDPNNLSLERGLMRLLLPRASGQGREKGIEILTSLEKRLPQDPELMGVRAALLLESQTPESVGKARALLENVVRLEPTAVKAHLTLVNLAMQANEYRAARDYAIRALGSNLNNRALVLARARAELALENYPMAVELAHVVLQEDPNSTEAIGMLVETGQRSSNRTLLDEARTRIEAAIHRSPTNERLLVSRAQIVAALGEPKAAIPELETYCQTAPGNQSITALVTLADLCRLAGDMDRSKQWIEQAQQLDANHQMVVHARLLWLASQNRLEELKGISAAYLSAKEQDPTRLVRAAVVLTALGPMELKQEALKLFEHAVALSPTSVDARLGLASALYQTGDAERAEKIYRQVLEQLPTNIRALNDLAWILQEHNKRYDAALELTDKGIRIAPEDLNLLDTRGTILMNLPNRLADAKNDFANLDKQLLGKTPTKAKNLLRLGRICMQLKEPTQAKQYLEAALDIDHQINVFTEAERAEITKILQESGK
jgi:tetratricopeptide (TPR) repeat protein